MATDKAYLEFILDRLSLTGEIEVRPMMGEFLLYHRGKLFGGVYDNRLLVKPTASAAALMPGAVLERPYPGGGEMLLVDNVDNREFLAALLSAMHPELPAPRARRRR